MDLSIYPSIYRSIYLSIYIYIYIYICPIYLSIYLSVCLSTYLSILSSLSLSVCLSVCLSICLSVYLLAGEGSYSAWLPQFLNLTTSKTQQFSETSSNFALDNIKNEAILRDILQKCKVECRADDLVPMRFAFFPLHLSKVLRLPRKIEARSYEVLHLSRKIIFPKLKIWCSKI